jgi:hypothetical protein
MTKKDNGRLTMDDETVYRFCGSGDGVPGLPEMVTEAEAQRLGMAETLAAALKRGTYKAVIKIRTISPPEPAEEEQQEA